jgi:hypothetical protein
MAMRGHTEDFKQMKWDLEVSKEKCRRGINANSGLQRR